jgi:hypothetical protein
VCELLRSGQLVRLDCSFNGLRPRRGTQVLAAALAATRLEELALGGNGLTDACSGPILTLLRTHPTLSVARLPNNQLGTATTKSIIRVMRCGGRRVLFGGRFD